MSRRKLQWKRRSRQAGGLDKIIPHSACGRGEWLTKLKEVDLPNRPNVGAGKGTQCTVPFSIRKEQLVRQWTK